MKLSIITINRNNAEGLRKTMESVFAQTYRDFEYIVIDGASADDSVDIIREYESIHHSSFHFFTFIWLSEPDTGIYNAMNKGLKMAHGEYTLMLNSGDYLVDEHVIERIIPVLHTEDMIQGNVIEEHKDKTIRYRGYGRSEISFIDVIDGHFVHQAMFIKLNAMKKYGYYDDNYKKAADSYFFITALGLGNATFRYVDIDVANFDTSGISSMKDPKWIQIDREEDARWYGEHISTRLLDFYKTAPRKIKLYDQLRKYKLIWYIAMGLVRISEWLSPTQPNVRRERVGK